MVDTRDLKSLDQKWSCRFDSCSGHKRRFMEWFENLKVSFDKVFVGTDVDIVLNNGMKSAFIGYKIPKSGSSAVIGLFQYRTPDKKAIGICDDEQEVENLFFVHHENGETGKLVKVIDSIHLEKCLLLIKMRVEIKDLNKLVLNYHKFDFKRDSRIDEMVG